MTHLDLKLRQEQESLLLIDLHCYFKAYFKDKLVFLQKLFLKNFEQIIEE
jgi:hypothetical protein